MFLIKKTYNCTNPEACSYGYQEHEFSSRYYKKYKGICNGQKKDGCGRDLAPSGYSIRWIRLVLLLVVIAAGVFQGPSLYKKYVPVILSGVEFVEPISEVNELDGSVKILVRRNNADERMQVKYTTEDSSAKAGEDYESDSGILLFNEGEKEKTIVIPIIADSDFRENRESFTMRLLNVESRPHHKVVILDQALDTNSQQKADALIRTASVLALDIAQYAVKSDTLNKLIKSVDGDSPKMPEFKAALDVNETNMLSARERYIDLFKDMSLVDHTTLLSRTENWVSALRRRDNQQQLSATQIMQAQLERFLASGLIEMDIWVEELTQVIPDIYQQQKKPDGPVRSL